MATAPLLRASFCLKLYDQYVSRLRAFKRERVLSTRRQRAFFAWVFRVHRARRAALVRPSQAYAVRLFRPYARRAAPVVNLRCYALCAAIMRHGQTAQAQALLSNVLILLTETTPERSGCAVVSSVLRVLEPAADVLVYRRGRNFFSMPVPLWPARRTFLAVRFLLRGVRRRRRTQRLSFRLALYQEILAVRSRQPDCYALRVFRQHRRRVLACDEGQAWRARKRRY
jgi:ribosomal protein S7